jgi:hypothetical protein
MTYYILYETTNLVNGKKYRGIHKTLKLNDGYLGSGKVLLNAVNKYGKENFHREVLEFCSSYEELLEKEKIYVDEDWVSDYSNYNLKTGGQSAGILSDESKNKISETLKRKYDNGEIDRRVGIQQYLTTEEINNKISITLKERYSKEEHHSKGSIPWNKDMKGQQVAWNKGLKLGPQSEEEKKKKSETLKKRYEIEEHHSKGTEPWNKGKKGVQVAWNKGIEMEKVECPHCGKKIDKLNAKKWHFDNCKLKPLQD